MEDTITGEDGLIRAANIQTSTGRTNRPIIKLYPLEVTAEDPLFKQHENKSNSPEQANTRHVCQAALWGREQVQEWTKTLCGSLEDVEN